MSVVGPAAQPSVAVGSFNRPVAKLHLQFIQQIRCCMHGHTTLENLLAL